MKKSSKSQKKGWHSKLRNIATMIAISLYALSLTTTFTACSGSDDDPTEQEHDGKGDKGDEHIATESILVQTMKDHPVYCCTDNNKEGFSLHSEIKSGSAATDHWRIHINMINSPKRGEWDGTYQIYYAQAVVKGFERGWEVTKAKLEAGDYEAYYTAIPNAYVKIEDLHRLDDFKREVYKITFHIDEMKEQNADYARDININYTGYIDTGGMLEY